MCFLDGDNVAIVTVAHVDLLMPSIMAWSTNHNANLVKPKAIRHFHLYQCNQVPSYLTIVRVITHRTEFDAVWQRYRQSLVAHQTDFWLVLVAAKVITADIGHQAYHSIA